MSTPTSILIGTPCYGGLVTYVYMQSVLKLLPILKNEGIAYDLSLLANDSLITRSRNTVASQFLDRPEFTHLLFIDADIGFDASAVLRLIRIEQEIAAGMYPVKAIDWEQVQKRRVTATTPDKLRLAGLHYVGKPYTPDSKEFEIRDGFVTGTYAATGFMLIKRSVFERMAQAYPELKYNGQHVYPLPKVPSGNFYNFFDCMIEPETGAYLSEDFTFCYRWCKTGGKVWLDTQSKLTHVGNYKFQGDFSA